MTRHWAITAGVAATVVAVGGIAVAVASDDEPADAVSANTAAVAVQARWGQQSGGQAAGGGGPAGRQHGRAMQQQRQPQQDHAATADLPEATSIDAATADELRYMAEEEKLAHDVYAALADSYDARQFSTIAAAETRHLESVRVLLDRYQVDDPTAESTPGEFTDDSLQQMYDELVARGAESLAAAAEVGVLIEQTDIDDLTAAIAGTDADDVAQVLGSLRDGSYRHLAAFERLVERA